MQRSFRVLHKNYERNNHDERHNSFREFVTESVVAWGDNFYDEKISYEDNLAYMCTSIFDDGFLEIKPGKFISVSSILQIYGMQEDTIVKQANNTYKKSKYRKVRRGDNNFKMIETNNNASGASKEINV